jgi:hypothetical protein
MKDAGTGLNIRATSTTTQSTHINHLPPELLAHIFGYLPDAIPEPFPFPIPESFHHWKVIMRVCRYWRTTALSTPSLWHTIHINKASDEAALQSLRLSGILPLKVLCTADLLDGSNSHESRNALADHALQGVIDSIDRLRELHILSSLTDAHWPWKFFTRPATQLEALTIISSDEDDIGTPYVFPPIFNAAETTSLKKVVLANVSLWPHDSFRNLRHLALYDQLDEARLPLHTFINILSQSPELETLILVSAGLEDDFIFDSSNLPQTVSLPFLQYLEIGDWSFEMVPLTFLKHLAFPTETTLCLWNIGWEADLRNLLLPRPDDPSLLQRCTKINITCFLDADHSCEASTLVSVKDSTIYYYASNVPPGFSTLRSLGQFTNVTELNYCPDHGWGKYGDIIDEDLLLMLPALKVLRVSKAIWEDLERLCSLLIQFEPRSRRLSELRKPSTSQSNSGRAAEQWVPGRPRFRFVPILEELHITHPYDHPDFHDTVKLRKFEDLQPLVLLANVRANNGVPLKTLEMQGCVKSVRSDLSAYFNRVHLLEKRYSYWEDSVSEVWPRKKLAKPPHPDW